MYVHTALSSFKWESKSSYVSLVTIQWLVCDKTDCTVPPKEYQQRYNLYPLPLLSTFFFKMSYWTFPIPRGTRKILMPEKMPALYKSLEIHWNTLSTFDGEEFVRIFSLPLLIWFDWFGTERWSTGCDWVRLKFARVAWPFELEAKISLLDFCLTRGGAGFFFISVSFACLSILPPTKQIPRRPMFYLFVVLVVGRSADGVAETLARSRAWNCYQKTGIYWVRCTDLVNKSI